MGALSALIVTTCVAPALVAILAVIAQSGAIARGAAALFALSFGMGTPLLVVGASAGKLLPKAGAWMDIVKRFFGVLMLAVAAWMLSAHRTRSAGSCFMGAAGAARRVGIMARRRAAASLPGGWCAVQGLPAASSAQCCSWGLRLAAPIRLRPSRALRPHSRNCRFGIIKSLQDLGREVAAPGRMAIR